MFEVVPDTLMSTHLLMVEPLWPVAAAVVQQARLPLPAVWSLMLLLGQQKLEVPRKLLPEGMGEVE